MAFRLTILLLLVIFGAMYLAPDAPPRPDRVADADPAPPAPAAAAPPAEDPVPEPAPDDVPQAAAPPPPAPLVPDTTGTARARDQTAEGTAAADPGADLPTVTVTPPPDDTGPVTLPGLGFGDPGGDTAAALSLSDGARARAAQAASDALADAPDAPIVNSVSEAANDLLRGLVAGEPAAPQPPGPSVTVTPPPQPTDPTPPPAGQLARVTGTAVNLRAGPSTANDVVGQVTFGQTLRVLDPDSEGWATVENPATGARAYIASQFLEMLP